jgi:hypothetical protein
MTQCAFEAYRSARLASESTLTQEEDQRFPRKAVSRYWISIAVYRLRGNDQDLPTTPTHISVFPVPMGLWIDLAIVAENPAELGD